MKKFYLILVFFCFHYTVFTQVKATFYFFDPCTESTFESKFDLFDPQTELTYSADSTSYAKIPKHGTYVLSATKLSGQYYQSFELTVIIDSAVMNSVDTIEIPRLLSSHETISNSTYWNYHFCDLVANGEIMDYSTSGNKRMAGKFHNGKPEMISYYRDDGTLEILEYFTVGDIEPNRVEYFNEFGELEEYDIYIHRKNKFVIKTYDPEGDLLYKSQLSRLKYN